MPQPKNLFLENKDLCKEHLAMVKSDVFESSVTFALADMACVNPSAEQLRGANYFLDILTHLSEKDEEREDTFAMPRLTPPEQLVPTKK